MPHELAVELPALLVPDLTPKRKTTRREGGFVVKKRLGSGSTSVALLVERDGKEGVLKVALDPGQNARLIEEGQVLHKLRHPNIVELYKPDNIGVGRTPSGKLTLILSDFSLPNTPVDNIRAGTPPYLDPFLRRRKPPRWDLYAERFAVAMTLHEMATGALPSWGDGVSDLAMLDCEADPVQR